MGKTNGPTPLRGLTAQDRKYWDEVYKSRYLQQGLSEEDIDRKYRNFHFKKAFKNDPNYNQLRHLSPEERDDYFNNNAYRNLLGPTVSSTSTNIPRITGPYAIEQSEPETPRVSVPTPNLGSVSLNPFNTGRDPFDLGDPYNQRLIEEGRQQAARAAREEEIQSNMDDYYRQHPSSGSAIQDWIAYGKNPLESWDKLARKYAVDKYNEDHRTSEQKKANAIFESDFNDYYKLYNDETNFLARGGNDFIEWLGISSPREKLATQYALKMQEEDLRNTTIIPQDENPYYEISSSSDLKNAMPYLSPLYKQWKDKSWLPEYEINWDELYEQVSPYIKSGRVLKAQAVADDYFDKILDRHQTFFNSDGNYGTLSSFGAGLAAGAVETLTEGLSFLPSFAVGLWQSTFNPSDLQLDGGFNWWERAMDNTIHNDWLGFVSNQNVQGWGDSIMEDRVIYGKDANSMFGNSAFTFGASLGTLAQYFVGIGEAKLAMKVLTAGERTAKKQIVQQGMQAAQKLYGNKATEMKNLFISNYGEAVQQGLDGEKGIYEEAAITKSKALDNYMADIYSNPNFYTYTQDDLKEAYSELPEEWQAYFNGINNGQLVPHPNDGQDAVDVEYNTIMRAKAIHQFNKDVPDFDEAVAIHARRKNVVDTQLQTAMLFLGDRLFGGVDKALYDFASARKILPKSTLSNIKGNLGNLSTTSGLKMAGRALLNTGKTAATEVITEVGQQTQSALSKQVAEHNIENFLNSHLYGNGAATLNGVSYAALYNVDKDEFDRDAALRETVFQTLLSTPLMPTIRYRGKMNPGKKRANQSWLSNAVQKVHYALPITTQVGNNVFNAFAQHSAAQDYVSYIKNWYSDPKHQDLFKGTAGIADFSIKMANDIANNDEVAYNNDAFSRTLAEAIMLNNIEETELAKTRIALLTNMANIKTATDEQKQAAINAFREETEGNQSVNNLNDEQILDLLEKNGKRVIDLVNKVAKENSKLDNIYGDNLNWASRSSLLFGKFAQEDLQSRISEKVKTINEYATKLNGKDLGTTDVESLKNKNHSKWHVSGQDILTKLSLTDRAFMLNPKNLSQFTSEQQKIITDTLNALRTIDPNAENLIRQVADESRNATIIAKEYEQALANPDRYYQKTEKTKAKKVKDNSSRPSRKFKQKVSDAANPSEIRKVVKDEISRQETMTNPDHDINTSLSEISDKDVRDRVNIFKQIDKSHTSIKKEFKALNLPSDIKETLTNTIDRLVDTANSVDELYDISNYSIDGLNPEQQAQLASIIQEALQKAKDKVNNSVSNIGETPKAVKPKVQQPKATNLDSRGIDTTPPVNNGPVTSEDEGISTGSVVDDASLDEDPIDSQPVGEVIDDELLDEESIDTKPTVTESQKGFNSKVRDILTKNTKRFIKSDGEVNRGSGWYQDENGYRYLRFHSLLGESFAKLSTSLQPLVAKDAIKRGNAFDQFCRVYFETHDFELSKQAAMNEFDISASYDNIKSFCDKLISEGYQTATHNLIVSGEFNGLRIAGDMDLLLEKDGKFYVADFKASAHNPANSFDYRAQLSFYKECLKKMGIDNVETLGFIWLHSNNTVTMETVGDLNLNEQYLAPFSTWSKIISNPVGYVKYLWSDRLREKKSIETTSGVLTTDGPQEIPSEPAPITEHVTKLASEESNLPSQDSNQSNETSTTEKYNDTDPRSITKIVRVQPNVDGPIYAYPVRDEDVQIGDAVEMTYNGRSHTQTIGKIQTIEEYNSEVESTRSKYTLATLATYPRPKFYNRHKTVYAGNTSSVISQPIAPITPTNNRSEEQQKIVDNNITPSIREIRRGNIDEHSYSRLGMPNHNNIESILEQEESFKAISEGYVQVGTKLFLVCSDETLDDGNVVPIVWIATDSVGLGGKSGKFKGIQLLNVLDTTNISGDRLALVNEVKSAWEASGHKDVFIYNDKSFEVEQLAGGTIPIKETNPIEANSEETINSTNLSTNLATNSDGKHGFIFKTKKGTNFVFPYLRQTRTSSTGSQVTKTTNQSIANKVEVIKRSSTTQSSTNEVLLCTPTPNGWRAAHSVYILRRALPNAISKYIEAVTNGKIGDLLKSRISDRVDGKDIKTSFSDILLFPNGYSEYIKYDSTHSRLDLGVREAQRNITMSAIRNSDGKWTVVSPIDARVIIDNNNGQGFTIDEISTKYLSSLVSDQTLNISMRINMDAIEKNPNILEALISDGMLWCPNAIPGRMLQENTRFRAPINPTPKVEETSNQTVSTMPSNTPQPTTSITSETTNSSVQESTKANVQEEGTSKSMPPKVESTKPKAAPRAKKHSSAAPVEVHSNTTTQTNESNTQLVTESKEFMAQWEFDELPSNYREGLKAKGITQSVWDKLTTDECLNLLNCIGA